MSWRGARTAPDLQLTTPCMPSCEPGHQSRLSVFNRIALIRCTMTTKGRLGKIGRRLPGTPGSIFKLVLVTSPRPHTLTKWGDVVPPANNNSDSIRIVSATSVSEGAVVRVVVDGVCHPGSSVLRRQGSRSELADQPTVEPRT